MPVLDDIRTKTTFHLPETASCYKEYIDALYEACSYLSTAEILNGIDMVSNAMISDILNAGDHIVATGNTYYISNDGNDDNDGLSPDTPWATIDKLKTYDDLLQPGDAVLFERGGEWRVSFIAQKGVSYGAYGSGPKPVLNGSLCNYADPSLWETTDIPFVYKCTEPIENAGVIVLDYTGILGNYNEKLATKEMVGKGDFTGVADLKTDNSYYNNIAEKTLYFCSHKGNPGVRYRSIEISQRNSMICSKGAAVIENFDIKFSGYGVVGIKYANVRNCVFSYMGGCRLEANEDATVVCGNAVEIYGNVDYLHVENCWIYQMCDTGLTHQNWTPVYDCIQSNITFIGNVIEYCFWSIEFNNPAANDNSQRLIENFTHSYNVCNMGGYGFGSYHYDRVGEATLYNCFGTNKTVNGVCEKNIFNRCNGSLYRIGGDGDKDIRYVRNINVQTDDQPLCFTWPKTYPYNDDGIVEFLQISTHIDPIFIHAD